MKSELRILDSLIKVLENSDVFQHKQEGLWDDISLGEVHCIDCIGNTDRPNVTQISETMGMTRGAPIGRHDRDREYFRRNNDNPLVIIEYHEGPNLLWQNMSLRNNAKFTV